MHAGRKFLFVGAGLGALLLAAIVPAVATSGASPTPSGFEIAMRANDGNVWVYS
jgi:hypothetical protein